MAKNKSAVWDNASNIYFFKRSEGRYPAIKSFTFLPVRMIKQFSVKSGNGVVDVDASLLNNGTYIYTLIVDGTKLETKK
jgi:hypothetical protein